MSKYPGRNTRYDFYSFCVVLQIADFGMARDLIDENYYMAQGGRIPVKWTAPEVLQRCEASQSV